MSEENPRMKAGYVRVDKNQEDGLFWHCVRDLLEGNCQFFTDGNPELLVVDTTVLLENYKAGLLYRKVETEIKAEKPVYTQAMKDAGELPSVGMVANAVSDCSMSDWGAVKVVYINKNQFVCIDDNEDVLIHYVDEGEWFEPIDTRTPEQKQLEEIAHTIDVNQGACSIHIAKEIQEAFFK